MTQAIVTPSRQAQGKAEKFEPGVQQVRLQFARIKRELRHIQHDLVQRPQRGPATPKGEDWKA